MSLTFQQEFTFNFLEKNLKRHSSSSKTVLLTTYDVKSDSVWIYDETFTTPLGFSVIMVWYRKNVYREYGDTPSRELVSRIE